jgi:hypothetical protein
VGHRLLKKRFAFGVEGEAFWGEHHQLLECLEQVGVEHGEHRAP